METAGADKALQMVGLISIGEKPVSTFTLGMRQRLGIARAIIHEPMNGLDHMGVMKMRELFVNLVRFTYFVANAV